MKNRILQTVAMLAIALSTLIVTHTVSYAQNRPFSAWNVTLQGESQGQTFFRQGVLYVTPTLTTDTTNDVNSFDVFLVSGDPASAPESGAIWLMTNNAIAGSPAQLDLAYMTFDPNAQFLQVQPDINMSAVGINIFNAYSGVTADVYQIFDGVMQIQSQDGFSTFSGIVDILGTGALFHSNTRYTAYLSGTYAGEGLW